jgi:hypothetical protein
LNEATCADATPTSNVVQQSGMDCAVQSVTEAHTLEDEGKLVGHAVSYAIGGGGTAMAGAPIPDDAAFARASS